MFLTDPPFPYLACDTLNMVLLPSRLVGLMGGWGWFVGGYRYAIIYRDKWLLRVSIIPRKFMYFVSAWFCSTCIIYLSAIALSNHPPPPPPDPSDSTNQCQNHSGEREPTAGEQNTSQKKTYCIIHYTQSRVLYIIKGTLNVH